MTKKSNTLKDLSLAVMTHTKRTYSAGCSMCPTIIEENNKKYFLRLLQRDGWVMFWDGRLPKFLCPTHGDR